MARAHLSGSPALRRNQAFFRKHVPLLKRANGVLDYCDEHRAHAGDGFLVTFLGTGSGPSRLRNPSSLTVTHEGGLYMFDAGEGSLHQLQGAAQSPNKIQAVFLTHLHGDHVFGLPSLVRAACSIRSKEPLRIYGPQECQQFLSVALRVSGVRPPRRVVFHSLITDERFRRHPDDIVAKEDGFWDVVENDKHTIRAGLVDHNNMFCLGYVMQEKTTVNIDVAKATALGLPPSKRYKVLLKEKSVTTRDGRVVHLSEVMKAPRRTRKLAIVGDCFDASNILPLCKDVDLVVHEATMLPGETALARRRGHSTPENAGLFARKCNASFLVLNHLSVRQLESLLDQTIVARKAFESPFVFPAYDFLRVLLTFAPRDSPDAPPSVLLNTVVPSEMDHLQL